jgi:hypothetical protein
MVTGILLLLTAYKLLSFHKQFNPTWAVPSSVYTLVEISNNWSSRIALLARDSIVYAVIIFGLWMLAFGNNWHWLVAFHYFVACLALLLVYDLDPNIMVSVETWVNIMSFSKYIYPHVSLQSSPVHIFNCSARYVCFMTEISCSNITIPGWAHDDEPPWAHFGRSRTYCSSPYLAIRRADQSRNGERGNRLMRPGIAQCYIYESTTGGWLGLNVRIINGENEGMRARKIKLKDG